MVWRNIAGFPILRCPEKLGWRRYRGQIQATAADILWDSLTASPLVNSRQGRRSAISFAPVLCAEAFPIKASDYEANCHSSGHNTSDRLFTDNCPQCPQSSNERDAPL